MAGSGLKSKKEPVDGDHLGDLGGFLFDLPVPTRPEKVYRKQNCHTHGLKFRLFISEQLKEVCQIKEF